MEYIRNNGTRVIVDGDNVQYGEGKMRKNIIGANFTNGIIHGGYLSSFNGSFNKELIGIETGLDIVNAKIGDIKDAYELLKSKISNIDSTDIFELSFVVLETVNEFFNGFDNIDARMDYYYPEDFDESKNNRISNLKGTGAAMCVERSALAQNLLKSLGINSFFKTSGIIKNSNKEVHSYNIIEFNNKYYAKVRRTNDKPYIVNVEITEDGVEYDCTCPCTFPCKHEYAVIMAITNQEYSNIELKPELKEKKDNLQNVLKQIPAEEIKEYLLSPKGADYVCFEMGAFEEHFRKYYPNQSYEYYYNNLYNALAVDGEYENMVDSYITKIRQYISNQEFEESFKILRSIINAYNDTNKLNFDDYIINQFANIGMLLRIINRKCDERTKQDIHSWIIELENDNYYNNLYLEDIVAMMNFNK